MIKDILFGNPMSNYSTRSLVMTATGNTYYYAHDANKNITELVASNGTTAAHYEYSPFGAIVSQFGSMSTTNPFTFSSEYLDRDLGLTYYNYRHYNPTDGRWISRDPLEERGGWNLYGMCMNNAVNSFDINGLYGSDVHFELMYLIALELGMSEEDAKKFAEGAQSPDVGKYDAISCALTVGGTVGVPAIVVVGIWFEDYRDQLRNGADYQKILHNLNGLSAKKLECFRKCLMDLLSSTTDVHQKGVIAHVLGDAYSHTAKDGTSIPNRCMTGHLKESCFSTNPDDPIKNPKKLEDFLKALLEGLGKNSSDLKEWNNIWNNRGNKTFAELLAAYKKALGKDGTSITPPSPPKEPVGVAEIFKSIEDCFNKAKQGK